jgi:hypothetical protein
MRDEMRKKLDEATAKKLVHSRNARADQLIEKWSKKKSIVGGEFQEKAHTHIHKYRNLSILLENFSKHVQRIGETTISSAFSNTPQNVMRVIRLGYPNSVRGEIFNEWAMETMRDSLFYLSPVYATTNRDATINTVTHQTATNRYSSEIEVENVDATGAGTNYTGTISITPLRPYKVVILVDSIPVAVDNGSETFTGTTLSTGTASTIDYSTGAYDITFTSAPGASIDIEYFYDSEDSDNYDELGLINLQLTDYQFRADLYPLGVSWSDKTELLLDSTLGIDSEEALMTASAQEIKKSLDFRACKKGYNVAKGNTVINFNADFAAAGSDSPIEHAQFITNAIGRAGNAIYNTYQRGGVSVIYGGPEAVNYLRLHKRFMPANTGVKGIGAFKAGSLDGMDIYQVPTSIVPTDELVCVWKNPEDEHDVSLSFGVYLPLAYTDKLHYMNAYKQRGMYAVEDYKVLNSGYVRRLKITNIPTE